MRLPGRSRSPESAGRAATSADYGKTASFLAIGVGLTGVITYAYFLIASHVLSKPDYGQITVLWSAVFITISTLYRPIEQLLSRHISERLVKGEPVGQPMRVASTIQLGLSLFFAVAALALRGPIQDGVLEGNEALYWVFFTSVLFYAASYFARGFLAGEQRFGLFVAMILSESCFRTIFAVMVAIDVLSGQSAVAIGITAAPALSLIVVPFAFLRRAKRVQGGRGMPGREAEDMPPSPDSGRNLTHPESGDIDSPAATGPARTHPESGDIDSPAATGPARTHPESGDIDSGPAPSEPASGDFSFKSGGGFAAAVLIIMFSEQAFLNAGPLIVRGLQGAAAAGFIFNVLMLARAPLQLFQAVSTSILPHLTTLHHSDAEDAEREFRHTVRMVLLGIAAFTLLAVVVVLIGGPTIMQILFSKKFTYDRTGLLLVGVGMGLYLSSVTVNQACIAQGQVRRAAARWIACAGLFIAWNFVPLVGDEFRRVELGFLLAAGVLFSLLYYVYRRPRERALDAPEPGSGEELEARLAMLDENV